MKKTVLLISLCIFAFLAKAQSKTNDALPSLSQSDFTVVERNSDGSIKSVRYAAIDNDVPATATEFFSTILKKRDVDDFVMDRSNDTDYGMHFERHQQFYQGIRVDDGHYNFRFKNGRMKGVRGHYVDVTKVNPVPIITEDGAINLYASYFGIINSDIIKSYVDLMIKEIPNEEGKTSVTALTYRVFLHTNMIVGGYVGFIDAHTGKLLYKETAYVDYYTTGQFYTYYNSSSNPKSGTTEYANNQYTLEDYIRGYGIKTSIQDTLSGTSVVIASDNDNIWTQQEFGIFNIALDVHWTMEKIYDIMKYSFNHSSYDGNYHLVDSYIFAGSPFGDGAYYVDAGNYFAFGVSTGNTVHGPLGSVDIIGHEYGHALLFRSSNLNNSGDTKAAIHEGLADIWGIIFEKRITPSADYWKTGEQVMTNGNSCERNFQNPSDATAHTQISSTYNCGAFYSTDPHIKGGLLPYWFYLLVNGGSGTNGSNSSYQLLPVDYDLAEQLIRNATFEPYYLQDCSSFQNVASALVEVAGDLGNDFLVEQVENSLYAVGLYTEPQHIYLQSYSPGSSTYYVYGNSNCSVSWSYTSLSGSTPTLVPNSSNYSCMVNTSSSFSGNLNVTIYYSGGSVTYSRYITGNASPSSGGGDVMQVIPLDDSHYQLSVGSENEGGTFRVYDASNLQMKVTERHVGENYLLDTSSWKRGLYIVEMKTGNKTYTAKIIKK